MQKKGKRLPVLAFVLALIMLCMPVTAMTPTRASGQFNVTVSAHKMEKAKNSFSLQAGETVTINASYNPASANVDFGLIAPDGHFHYLTAHDGSINKTIEISERGNYTFAVRNNSSVEITVMGFVNY